MLVYPNVAKAGGLQREVSRKWCFYYDNDYNNGILAILCHVVYETLRIMRIVTVVGPY